jgi:hypothetical protein
MKSPLHNGSVLLTTAALVLLVLSRPATAEPITYLYEGTGSGTIGPDAFVDAAFRITARADADDVAFWALGGDAIQNTHSSANIAVAGLGSFAILTPSHTWGSNEFLSSALVGLGRAEGANWITVNEQPLYAYNLATSVGPILETNPQDVEQFHDVVTTGGLLTFTVINEVTFTAIIPEPGSLGLAWMALISLVRHVPASRFRRRGTL